MSSGMAIPNKISRVFLFIACILLLSPFLYAKSGPHGGEFKSVPNVVGEASLELVIEKKGDLKEIHVYGLRDGKASNLAQSGYGGLVLKIHGMEFPLDLIKVDADGRISNAPEAVEHYFATAKFPDSPDVELVVTVAFPSKQGTGTVIFKPYR